MNRCGLWVGLMLLPLAVCACHRQASCPTSNISFLKHFTHRPLVMACLESFERPSKRVSTGVTQPYPWSRSRQRGSPT